MQAKDRGQGLFWKWGEGLRSLKNVFAEFVQIL